VYFTLSAGANTLRVPVNTVLFRAQGLQVATLDREHRVRLKSITQGRDFGTEIEVLTGLEAADTLVVNPPDSISEGAACASRSRERRRMARQDLLMRRAASLTVAVLGALSGCSLSPRYQRPSVPAAPDSYKEAGEWKLATPADAAARGRWWTMYQDRELDELEAQVTDANQSLRRRSHVSIRRAPRPEWHAQHGSRR